MIKKLEMNSLINNVNLLHVSATKIDTLKNTIFVAVTQDLQLARTEIVWVPLHCLSTCGELKWFTAVKLKPAKRCLYPDIG